MSQRQPLQPLNPFAMLLLPLLLLTSRGIRRETLRRRAEKTQRIREQRKAQRQLAKELQGETAVFEKLIIDCLTRLGEAYLPRMADVSTNGKLPKKRRVQRVQFARRFTSPELIWFQIATNRRTLTGSSKQLLPQHVKVADLVSDETLYELGMACGRKVAAARDDPRKGAWIIVHRLEGFDGVPLHVSYRDILPHFPPDTSRGPILIGIGEHRKVHTVDLASHPHVLVGGSSGGGKSNIINHIISSLMRFSDPKLLKFVLIDLKRMEFGFYENSPHLLRPVVFEADEAIDVLEFMVSEVVRRSQMLSGKAKELAEWNKRYPSHAMPRIILVIDEFAELMIASGRTVAQKVENHVTRVTNLGRAVGVHVIVATQRPAVSVIPNTIKVNMPLIISARVPNAAQSSVILGDASASKLPVLPGRMIYLSGSQRATLQTPHVQDDDVIESVRIARGRALGIVRLQGYDAEIVPETLTTYIYDCLKGSLSPDKLWYHLRDFGVPGRQLKAYLAELIKMGSVEIGNRYFVVEKRGNGWRLVEPDRAENEPEPEQPSEPEPMQFLLTAGLPALRAPAQPETVIDVQAQEVPNVDAIELTDVELVKQFIRECCIQSKKSRIEAAALYDAFNNFCETLDLETISKKRFGQLLNDMHYGTKRGTGGTAYRLGLELLAHEKAA